MSYSYIIGKEAACLNYFEQRLAKCRNATERKDLQAVVDTFLRKVARPPRLERGTLCLEGRCSIQLSYGRTPKIGHFRVPFSTLGKAYPEIVPASTKNANSVALKR